MKAHVRPSDPHPLRLSSVAFFNSVPLVYGLDRLSGLQLRYGVPSALLDDLLQDRADVALLPVIDYQRGDGFRMIRATGIGSDGATLTVRLFAPMPIEHTRVLAVDADSHTSVALARIILNARGLRPEIIPLDRATGAEGETRLLIGDKVITHAPHNCPHQLDLGEAWKQLTGLPFVFAIWTAREHVVLGDLPRTLQRALEEGLNHVDELVARHAVPRGWPADLARRYLTEHLQFRINEPEIAAIERFHQMTAEIGVIGRALQPLRWA